MITMKKLTIATAFAGLIAAGPLAAQDAPDRTLSPEDLATIQTINDLNACAAREKVLRQEKQDALARPFLEAGRAAMMQLAHDKGFTAEQQETLMKALRDNEATTIGAVGGLVAEFTNLPGVVQICETDKGIDGATLLNDLTAIASKRGYWVYDLFR